MQRLDDILHLARNNGYSDVHLGGENHIMMRNNGILFPYEHSYTTEDVVEMILSMLDENQKERLNAGKDIDLVYVENINRYRVNVYKERGQLCAALRVIYERIRSLEELQLPPILNKLTKDNRGLVLLTGPTGSGKSTTLAAMINEINHHRKCHILTIEDPIEYVYRQDLALIHQREVEFDVESFDTALKSALREDPDVILVGEMRDYETIQAVMTLAETGHLVFSTLHTIGAAKTIDRIVDVFPPHKQEQIRTQLSGVLNAVVTQQLIPTADGKSRVAALEVMLATPAVANLIRENKGHQINSMIQTGSQFGMQSLNMCLVSLLRQGKISRESAIQYTDNIAELQQMI
ncbi:MAG: type IV pilus twitching motility protein PilT [Longibaculum muris]|uniref:Twitching motility protein PilT n=1 Tax=Longibaculum muris TaxID=1796628 RepID=A0A4R3Z9I6_9FIRM|nr:type IV pilus twitching motility protein PilT [Longibaculum muris]KXU44820.1 twitching motility protein [Candidatus Stoquefichus sp. KLE1796]MBS5369558.1 type IV pilus twitching motility protein PilT [Coprobacillus cateniformis]MCR1887808.1 type IV pilus twitching motility protein PilT [Longibaculum muris]MED9812130.1 type IV pilus twitching motility protein PilT [Longibaculum muris]TCW01286.1 twitching motility protein PilT [Longibaculum muris]